MQTTASVLGWYDRHIATSGSNEETIAIKICQKGI